jgi:hypothetical protein
MSANEKFNNLLQNEMVTPYTAINWALAYLRDENGKIDKKDIMRIMDMML